MKRRALRGHLDRIRAETHGLAGDSLIYALPSVASAVMGFMLTPLVTRRLSLSEYGQLENFNVLVGALSVVAGLNLSAGAAVLLRSGAGGEGSARVVSSVAALSLLAPALIALAIGGLGGSLGRFLGWGDRAGGLEYVAITCGAAASFLAVLQTVLRQRFEKKKSLTISFVGPLVYALLVLGLVGLAGGGLGSVLASLLAGPLVALLVGVAFVRNELQWRHVSGSTMMAALRISLPFCVAGWAALVTKSADRFLLMAWVTEPLDKIALYAAAEKLLIPILLVSQGFGIAFPPVAMRLANSPDAAAGFRRMYLGYVGLSSLLMVMGTAMAPAVASLLLPRTFRPAIELVPAVSFYLAIGYLFYVFSGGLLASGKTQWLTVASVTAAVINISLNALLIPEFGLKGAIWATNVAAAVYAILVAAAAEHVYPVGYPLFAATIAYASAYGLAELSLGGAGWALLAIALQAGLLLVLHRRYSPTPPAPQIPDEGAAARTLA